MLKYLGATIAVAAGAPTAARLQARAQGLSSVGDALVSLNPQEAATLRAMIARIIPADASGPGALEARADRFIDRGLAGALKSQRAAYATGLAAIDDSARSAKGASFAKLPPADQDVILTDAQAGRLADFNGSAQFFNMVRTNTIQGTFSDPFYGGNENFIGWDMIGYPGSRIAVSANLQRMDIKPEPSRKSAYDYAMFNKGEI